MIEVQHLTKRYGRVTAVDDVSFRVERGEILGFLGPNGAGKTTTMRILTGYMPATEGRAMVAGFDVFDEPIEAKRRIGYLPETPPLYPDMTVREYLDFVARIKGVPSKERRDASTRHEAHARRRHGGSPVRQAVQGLQQRVGLAQALIHNPEVLILDEPTAGLDPKQIIETRDLIAASPAITRSSSARTSSPRSADLPARRDHQQGTRGRRRYAREPDRAAARARRRSTCRSMRGAPTWRRAPGVPAWWRDASEERGSPGARSRHRAGRDIRRDVARKIVDRGWGCSSCGRCASASRKSSCR